MSAVSRRVQVLIALVLMVPAAIVLTFGVFGRSTIGSTQAAQGGNQDPASCVVGNPSAGSDCPGATRASREVG